MIAAGFLFDEHFENALIVAVRQRLPLAFVAAVGDGVAPPKRTPDPRLIEWAEERDLYLVSLDRSTMQRHLDDHLRSGRHTLGILIPPRNVGMGYWIDMLETVLGATFPDEFRDQVAFL